MSSAMLVQRGRGELAANPIPRAVRAEPPKLRLPARDVAHTVEGPMDARCLRSLACARHRLDERDGPVERDPRGPVPPGGRASLCPPMSRRSARRFVDRHFNSFGHES
jgi:hypothetical protein